MTVDGSKQFTGAEVFNRLAGFWVDLAPTAEVQGLCIGFGQLAQQNHQDLLQAADCYAFEKVPTYRNKLWYPLDILESQRVAARSCSSCPAMCASLPDAVAFPVNDKLVSALCVQNRMFDESRSLLEGVDVFFARGWIYLLKDPFTEIGDWYNQTLSNDRQARLWLHRSEWDYEYPTDHLGYLLDTFGQSHPTKTDAMRALIDGRSNGGTELSLRKAAGLITGSPVADDTEEVVDVFTSSVSPSLVVTDKKTYAAATGASPVVSIGDVVAPGDSLFDGSLFTDFNLGQVPDWMPNLVLPGHLLGLKQASILLVNEDVNLEASWNGDRIYVEFSLGGAAYDDPEDDYFVAAFNRGYHHSPSLPRLIADFAQPGRLGPSQTVILDDLPDVINPLKFFASVWLRYAVTVLRLRSSTIVKECEQLLPKLRHLTPATRAIVLNFDGDVPTALATHTYCRKVHTPVFNAGAPAD